MQRLREHSIVVTLAALGLAGGAVLVIAGVSGLPSFAHAWSDLHVGWLAITIGAELLAVPVYVVAYRTVARVHEGPALPAALAVRVVTAGFGPFAVGGGFALDRKALYAVDNNARAATVRVLGLGALEWSLLAPAAWISAVALLADGDPRVMKSLLWPWAIAVPVGFGLGLWFAAPRRRQRIAAGGGRWRSGVRLALDGVAILYALGGGFRRYWTAWLGLTLYWVLDIASFYGAVRFVGLHLTVGEAVLAYATGYALTRRSMPLGGAGATEALLTFALHWVGQPVAASLAAVVVYRLFNFALLAVPALCARARVKPLLDAADEDQPPAPGERERAAAPLLPMR